jgi:hypothetical protein
MHCPAECRPVLEEGKPDSSGFRYADGEYNASRNQVVMVRETENAQAALVVNEVVYGASVLHLQCFSLASLVVCAGGG